MLTLPSVTPYPSRVNFTFTFKLTWISRLLCNYKPTACCTSTKLHCAQLHSKDEHRYVAKCLTSNPARYRYPALIVLVCRNLLDLHSSRLRRQLVVGVCMVEQRHRAESHDYRIKISIVSFFSTRKISTLQKYLSYRTIVVTGWRSWLRQWATTKMVAGSIAEVSIGIFHWYSTSGTRCPSCRLRL